MAAFIALCQSLPNFTPDVLCLLTTHLLDPCPDIRNTVLTALGPPHDLPASPELQVAVLIARHDSEEESRELAEKYVGVGRWREEEERWEVIWVCPFNQQLSPMHTYPPLPSPPMHTHRLWDSSGYSLSCDLGPLLISHASGDNTSVQDAVAQALALWLESNEGEASNTLDTIMQTYRDKRAAPPPQKDAFGRVIVTEFKDPWESRVGVAKALEQLPKFVDASRSMDLLKFVIPDALSDPRAEVQGAIVAAARAAISTHGEVGYTCVLVEHSSMDEP